MADEDEEQGAEDEREPYFGSLYPVATVEGGAIMASVSNDGSLPLPPGSISVHATVNTPDGSPVADLGWKQSLTAVLPGEDVDVGPWTPTLDDGAYSVWLHLIITDDRGGERGADRCGPTNIDVSAGVISHYHPDDISRGELGDDFHTPGSFDAAFDPHPYIVDGELVVSIHNTGSEPIPQDTIVEVASRMEPVASAGLPRDLVPDDRCVLTLPLGSEEPGAHFTWVSVDAEGKGDRELGTGFQVVWQSSGPVDVLYE